MLHEINIGKTNQLNEVSSSIKDEADDELWMGVIDIFSLVKINSSHKWGRNISPPFQYS